MALETIEFEGKPYVPSKQAAEATGYTQDYIGQLARAGSILARRVGGLWYINMEALERHKKDSEAYVPEPPTTINDHSGSIVSFDGKEYVSSKRAAELTAYTQDYVGQLARSGKIKSRQMGGRWYVSKDDLKDHKTEKDAMLAAVQADAVGVGKQTVPAESFSKTDTPLYTYFPSEGSDLPTLVQKESKIEEHNVSRNDISDSRDAIEVEEQEKEESAIHHIAIRAMGRDVASEVLAKGAQGHTNVAAGYSKYRDTWNVSEKDERVRAKRKNNFIPALIVVFFITLGGSLYVSGVLPKLFAGIIAPTTIAETPAGSPNRFDLLTERFVEALSSTESYQRN